MFERAAGVIIEPAEEGPAHASLDAMIGAGGVRRGDVGAGACHVVMIAGLSRVRCREMPRLRVRKFRIMGVPQKTAQKTFEWWVSLKKG
jgi:hypothetical protein